MKTLIDRIADQLGMPESAPVSPVKRDMTSLQREFLLLHQLHTMHKGALLDAMMIEARAIENTRHVRKLVAETGMRLGLLAAEVGVPAQPASDEWTDEVDQARADAGDTRQKAELEDRKAGVPHGN